MKKLLSTTLAVGVFASMCLTPVMAIDANALPQTGSWGSLNKNVDITTPGEGNMNVAVKGAAGTVGEAHWDSFNVGSNAHVNFEFTGHNQTAFNQVHGTNMSEIYGSITSSSCASCVGMNYDATSKVILVNPNGVLFGKGANVNLNSFTATDMNAKYIEDSNGKHLDLTAKSQKGGGIQVQDGATITGHKGVVLASDKGVYLYKGSVLKTDTGINGKDEVTGEDAAFGKVKIVTADGVNFYYYNNGGAKEIGKNLKTSSDHMRIYVDGEIDAGNIDIRNYSTSNKSMQEGDKQIVSGSIEVMENAKLKATKAVRGNDGNIWLTAANRIVLNDANLTTVEGVGTQAVDGGNVKIQASNNASVNADIKAAGNVSVKAGTGNAIVGGSNIVTSKDVTVEAGKLASIQTDKGNGKDETSTVQAKNVTVKGKTGAALQATVDAQNDITIEGGYVQFANANLKANGTIKGTSTTGDVYGSANFNNSKTKLYSNKDLKLTAEGVGNSEKGLVAVAENDLNIETNGDLSISVLAAKNGNMHLKSNKLVMGKDYVDKDWQIPEDNGNNRSFIYVLNGEFESVGLDGQDNYTITKSDSVTADEKYQARHHIEGKNNTDDKFVLITKKPYTKPSTPPSIDPVAPEGPQAIDDNHAQYLNKMPRQPEVFNNNTNINNGRTALVDVFAAASQIEIEDDDEEE